MLSAELLQVLEWAMSFVGLLAVLASSRAWLVAMPLNLVGILLSSAFYYFTGLYGETAVSAVFFIMYLYGYWQWNAHKGKNGQEVDVRRAETRHWMTAGGLGVFSTITLGLVTSQWASASYPWTDAVIAGLNFGAAYLQAKRCIENWYVWIAVNVASIFLYLQKDFQVLPATFAVYLALAVYGAWVWARKVKQTTA